jgi:hypothetical protein
LGLNISILHTDIDVQIAYGTVDDKILTIICDDGAIHHHDEDLVKETYSSNPGSLALATVWLENTQYKTDSARIAAEWHTLPTAAFMRHLYIYYQHYHMGFLPVFVVGSQYKETWRIVLRAYFFRYYDLNEPYPVSHTISNTLETIPFCYQLMEDFPHHKAEPQKNVPNHYWAKEYAFFEDHRYNGSSPVYFKNG